MKQPGDPKLTVGSNVFLCEVYATTVSLRMQGDRNQEEALVELWGCILGA